MREHPTLVPRLSMLFDPEVMPMASPALADSPEHPQPVTDLSRFLPPSLLAAPRPTASTVVRKAERVPLHEVNQAFIDIANAAQEGHVIDPNGELDEQSREELERFLNFHATDARIALHVLLLGRGECLPSGVELAKLGAGRWQQSQTCLAIVPLGEAWRTRLFLSRDVTESIKPAALGGLMDDVTAESLSASDATEQLHRLLVRLSVRLFWLQRELPLKTPAVAAATVAQPEREASPTPLQEVPSSQPISFTIEELRVRVAAIALVLMLGGIVWWRWQRYRLRHHEWILPEPKSIQPRLGGPHCGGAMSMRFR